MMTKSKFITVIFAGVFSVAVMQNVSAEQKYHLHLGPWETVNPNSALQYNPHESKWKTTSPNSAVQYNPHEGDKQYAPDSANSEYHQHSGRWKSKIKTKISKSILLIFFL
jgi:hypothetical protein